MDTVSDAPCHLRHLFSRLKESIGLAHAHFEKNTHRGVVVQLAESFLELARAHADCCCKIIYCQWLMHVLLHDVMCTFHALDVIDAHVRAFVRHGGKKKAQLLRQQAECMDVQVENVGRPVLRLGG